MVKHFLSREDKEFKNQVETCDFPGFDFDHRAHFCLAHVYLAGNDPELAVQRMRDLMTGLLKQALSFSFWITAGILLLWDWEGR